MMKFSWNIALIGVLIFTLVLMVILTISGYILVHDVNALIDRAQVSADRDDMVEYLELLKKNMKKHKMTQGHTAIIFKTPANDMALHYKTVKRVLERLESIKNISKDQTAYQVAMNDIRGVVRELPNPAMGWLWASNWFWMIGCGIVCFICWFLKIK